jgi:hypothetical protein
MTPLHEHVLDRLDAYLEGTLSADDAAAVRRHCRVCESCRAAFESFGSELGAERRSAANEPGDGAARRSSASHAGGRGRRFWQAFWMSWAASAAILAGIYVYYSTLKPSPYDLRVLGQSSWLTGSDAALHLRVLRRDGRMEPGAPVAVELAGAGRRVQLASLKTGGHGEAAPRFRLPDWPDGSYQLQVTANPRGADRPETVTRTINLRHSWRLMVSTDKPVYQPGQVIRMRGLALRRPDLRPLAGQPMGFSVTDPRGNVVFREARPASRFGIGSADCPIAGEVIEGPYRIECRVGDATAGVTVEVRPYVLPRFKVALTLDQPYYQPGQAIKGKVQADYVFGKPVADGAVSVALETEDLRPRAIATVQLRTGADGSAAFELRIPETLIGREQDAGAARISVAATVRDPAGQTQGRSESRVVAAQPIRIEVVPEAGALVEGLPNTVHLLTTTLDGRPVRTRLAVPGLDGELQTSEQGVASFEFTPREGVNWFIRATDEQGRTGSRRVVLRCDTLNGDYLVRTDKAVYDGGEPIRVTVLAGGVEPVFLDLIKDGQTVLSEIIAVEKGRGERSIDVPPELSGTIVLHTYRYGPEGLPSVRSRVIQVRPARALAIRMTPDRPEYRPGDKAAIRFTLTDDRGQPTPGAISLAAVDEAVFGVLDRRPGLERTFFNLEQELLKPVYEIEDWSPDEDGGGQPAERRRLEQALFARTATGQGAVSGGFAMGSPPVEAPASPGLHSLVASSYPEKVQQVVSLQNSAESWIGWGWVVLILAAVVGGLLWSFSTRRILLFEFLVSVVILGVLIGLLMPAVQSAREAGRRVDARAFGMATEAPAGAAGAKEASGEPVRVRRNFPETLLWRPELITDDQGQVRLELDLADSITTWRVSMGAVAADGRLGAGQAALRVFQPFFVDIDLPSALTRGDEIGLPVVVSNYLDRPQAVTLSLQDAPWFERLEPAAERTLQLQPSEVRSTHFRIRARAVGNHEIQVTAKGSERGIADAVRRPIEVVPDGRRVERVVSGTLQRPAEVDLDVPGHAIPGSVRATVKIYPSTFSQLVEGLEAIFQQPYGCFEQTSSTTYPNVLALDYLRRTGRSVPAVEARARQYIHLGYQRLLSFEITGGGFDWFGNPPANRTLTAYGLMEFQDMARVHDVDPRLIERTRQWLSSQQKPDGSWEPEAHMLHEDPTGAGRDQAMARLGTTAYIAWSVFSGQAGQPGARSTLAYLQGRADEARDDPYVLALVANALLVIEPEGSAARSVLDRLEPLQQPAKDGKPAWWGPAGSEKGSAGLARRTLFHGGGDCRRIETTALAALALTKSRRSPERVRNALAWLVAQKDGRGTWGSTQATVLALQALLAGTGKPLGGGKSRRISIVLDGEPVRELTIPADRDDVLQQVDLTAGLASSRSHRLNLEDRSGTESGYHVLLRYHEPEPETDRPSDAEPPPLSIGLEYDRSAIAVDENIAATATVVNNRRESAPMVILDLPIPAGFMLDADDLSRAVKAGTLAKFQVTARSAIVYLRDLQPGVPLTVGYHLRATMPVKLTVPAARAYEYYDPARRGSSRPARLAVKGS